MILEVLFRFMTAGVIGSSISTAIYFMVVYSFWFFFRRNKLEKKTSHRNRHYSGTENHQPSSGLFYVFSPCKNKRKENSAQEICTAVGMIAENPITIPK